MAELKKLILRKPRLTLAVAESMTCGRVQAKIGEISGASEFFLGGITAYTLDLKVDQLGVNRAAAKKVDCVSGEIAEQMARGVCELFGADMGVATTGYAEPSADQNISAPFAWWALAMRRGRAPGKFGLRHGRVECPGASRVEAQAIVAEAVIAELLAWLREVRG